jgi:hypothetical protein
MCLLRESKRTEREKERSVPSFEEDQGKGNYSEPARNSAGIISMSLQATKRQALTLP